ncbi:riboflavin kinase [Candidatus Peregrinibacteria bacterium]|nr:riboflavin kinase [Candidatus Peregrinibacteria bacterium]
MMKIQISGAVIKGLGVGKKLGFPTLNLNPSRAPKKMKFGVYAAQVKTPVGEFNGVLHYGPRPTINAPISLEVYCIGLKRRLYGKKIRVFIKKRLRAVKKFKNTEVLKKQIKKDVKEMEILALDKDDKLTGPFTTVKSVVKALKKKAQHVL